MKIPLGHEWQKMSWTWQLSETIDSLCNTLLTGEQDSWHKKVECGLNELIAMTLNYGYFQDGTSLDRMLGAVHQFSKDDETIGSMWRFVLEKAFPTLYERLVDGRKKLVIAEPIYVVGVSMLGGPDYFNLTDMVEFIAPCDEVAMDKVLAVCMDKDGLEKWRVTKFDRVPSSHLLWEFHNFANDLLEY